MPFKSLKQKIIKKETLVVCSPYRSEEHRYHTFISYTLNSCVSRVAHALRTCVLHFLKKNVLKKTNCRLTQGVS